ncbi:MAG: arginine deiminase [Defluviitaleaceae bacterium]|nr:arginine deiminase [Defluviitaleaceae bacterium]
MNTINVNSEIGKLKKVILKRPGREIENLTPEYLKELLFDDIPYLPNMQKEHDGFAQVLRDRDIEVLYLENLMTEALSNDTQKEEFIDSFLKESNYLYGYTLGKVKEFLLNFSTDKIVERIMGGIRTDEINIPKKKSLLALTLKYPFYVSPMPNLYFTRDPAASIGNGISISKMKEPARRKESLFIKFIIENHPMFKDSKPPVWLDRNYKFSIEGGDMLVLSESVLAIGISERTTAAAIEHIAKNLFAQQGKITKVLAVNIPKSRAFMHLDTVFTMLDHNKFSIHPKILDQNGKIDVYILEKGDSETTLQITHKEQIDDALKSALGLDEIEFIACGGGDVIAAPREQWADGTNTLAIAPGVVITYDRNDVTNKIFRERGLETIEIASAELSRGRGGPRCMSMPIYRED